MIIINMEVLYGGSSQTSMMVRVAEIVNNEKPLMFVQSKLLELGCELGSLIAFKIKLKDLFLRAVCQIPVSAYHQVSSFLLQKAQKRNKKVLFENVHNVLHASFVGTNGY